MYLYLCHDIFISVLPSLQNVDIFSELLDVKFLKLGFTDINSLY